MVRIRAEDHGKVFQQQLVNHFFHDIEDRMRYNHKVHKGSVFLFSRNSVDLFLLVSNQELVTDLFQQRVFHVTRSLRDGLSARTCTISWLSFTEEFWLMTRACARTIQSWQQLSGGNYSLSGPNRGTERRQRRASRAHANHSFFFIFPTETCSHLAETQLRLPFLWITSARSCSTWIP